MFDLFKKKVKCPICGDKFVDKKDNAQNRIETITNYGENNQDSKSSAICTRCDNLRVNLSD